MVVLAWPPTTLPARRIRRSRRSRAFKAPTARRRWRAFGWSASTAPA